MLEPADTEFENGVFAFNMTNSSVAAISKKNGVSHAKNNTSNQAGVRALLRFTRAETAFETAFRPKVCVAVAVRPHGLALGPSF